MCRASPPAGRRCSAPSGPALPRPQLLPGPSPQVFCIQLDSKPGLILQHGPAGPPDILGEWLDERGISYEVHRAWEAPPPPVEGRPFLASLGAPQSAGPAGPPWVSHELEAMRRAVEAEVPVLGLCFGGQTLALALGGGLERAAEPEIGWL